jgi:redox-sensitive bicupin YhaK (pirin superfamily)
LAKEYPVMRSKMKKKIRFSVRRQCAWLGEIKVQQVLPDKFARTIGPFVFLEHIISYKQSLNESHKGLDGNCSHACRGIARLTYILAGEVEHMDSIGNHIKLSSGGVHWMKAGKGIVHGEAVRPEYRMRYPNVSVVRFWINLPSKYKSEEPEYISLLANDIPKQILTDDAGWIKILSGEYENMSGKVPCYSKQFLYHIQLEARKQFSTITDGTLECAAFLLTNSAVINDMRFDAGEFIGFSSEGELIKINNNGKTAVDIILFGGEPYNEPIVMEGTFVMNTPHEITQAYNDYYDGKYGQIKPQ